MMISGTRYRLTAEMNRQQRLAQDIARAQSDISTGKRLQGPSDDPAAAARIADIRKVDANQKTWISNIDSASALSAQLDANLTSVASAIDRAHDLVLAAANATLSNADRATIALELRGIADDLDALAAQRDSRGQPLYVAGTPLEVPIGQSLTVAPASSRLGIFDGIVTPSGTSGLSQILGDAADAITLADPTARTTASAASIDALGAAAASVTGARGEQGVRAARLDNARDRLLDAGLDQTEERNALESTDVTETVARLQAKLLSLEAAQAAFARVSQRTLFDLLG